MSAGWWFFIAMMSFAASVMIFVDALKVPMSMLERVVGSLFFGTVIGSCCALVVRIFV